MLSYEELSASERALWDAFPEGRLVDLRTGTVNDDPATAQEWGDERTVRAHVVAALLLGAQTPQPGAVAAVRLAGARITGRLDLAGAQVEHLVWLESCWLTEEVSLYGTATRTIGITGSRMRGLTGNMARIEGRLDLQCSTLEGILELKNARVGGELILDCTEIVAPGGWAVDAGGLVMEGGVWGRKGFTTRGGIRIPGATLPGGLFLNEARLHNPGGIALRAENATASTMVFAQGFTAHGLIQLQGTHISGPVDFAGADLSGQGTAVDCTRMQAAALDFTPAVPPSGTMNLQGARVDMVHDTEDSWPEAVLLHGFVYGTLADGAPGHDAARRIAWLRRTPGYAPQPYEQLAAWYRQVGHDDEARRVLLAKQRHRRHTLGPAGRAWSHLLDLSVGFGYRPWLAGLWLTALGLLGTAVFSSHDPRPAQNDHGSPFNPLVYTLDLLIPIGGLGQRTAWYWPDTITQWVAYALIAAGWLLTTAVVAGVTRTLSKN